MKKITLSLLLCLICLSGMAQSSKKLDLKDITSGKYRAENIRNVVPMPDGEHYTQILFQNRRTGRSHLRCNQSPGM